MCANTNTYILYIFIVTHFQFITKKKTYMWGWLFLYNVSFINVTIYACGDFVYRLRSDRHKV